MLLFVLELLLFEEVLFEELFELLFELLVELLFELALGVAVAFAEGKADFLVLLTPAEADGEAEVEASGFKSPPKPINPLSTVA